MHFFFVQTDEGDVEAAVKGAIDAGYRFFDTAYMYGNEKEVGNGVRSKIEDGTVTREELFICTKVNKKKVYCF